MNTKRWLCCGIGAFMLLGTLVVVAGCTTMELPDYEAPTIDEYPQRDMKNGLAAAIRTMTDEEESKTYFGTDLFAADVLVVFVIIENRTDGSSFVVSKEDFHLGTREAIEGKVSEMSGIGSESGGQTVAMVGAVLISPVLLFAGAKMISDATVIKHNVEVDAFQTQTLSPGERGEGFVYFQLPEDTASWPDQWILSIEAMDLKTKEVTSFVFEISLERK